MPSIRLARLDMLHRRSVQRMVAAGAVVALATGLATIEALADDTSDEPEVRTVNIAASEELQLAVDAQTPELTPEIRDALDDYQQRLEEGRDEAEAAAAEVVAAEAAEAEAAEAEAAAAEAAEPEPEPEPAPAPSGAVDPATWDRLAQCESGGNWSIDTGNGFYGGLQFTVDSWQWVGGSGYPHHASKQEQIARAEILLERQGWQAWPSCSRQLGLR